MAQPATGTLEAIQINTCCHIMNTSAASPAPSATYASCPNEPADSGLGSTIVISVATAALAAVSMLVIWTQVEPVITLVSRAVS